MKYIIDIHGEIEGDYDIIGKYEERPQGEWLKARGEWVTDMTYKICFKCSECKTHIEFPFNFCPNCGASMKGGEE